MTIFNKPGAIGKMELDKAHELERYGKALLDPLPLLSEANCIVTGTRTVGVDPARPEAGVTVAFDIERNVMRDYGMSRFPDELLAAEAKLPNTMLVTTPKGTFHLDPLSLSSGLPDKNGNIYPKDKVLEMYAKFATDRFMPRFDLGPLLEQELAKPGDPVAISYSVRGGDYDGDEATKRKKSKKSAGRKVNVVSPLFKKLMKGIQK